VADIVRRNPTPVSRPDQALSRIVFWPVRSSGGWMAQESISSPDIRHADPSVTSRKESVSHV